MLLEIGAVFALVIGICSGAQNLRLRVRRALPAEPSASGGINAGRLHCRHFPSTRSRRNAS